MEQLSLRSHSEILLLIHVGSTELTLKSQTLIAACADFKNEYLSKNLVMYQHPIWKLYSDCKNNVLQLILAR